MSTHCPICGNPFSAVDMVLAELDAGFQCHHCWNRIHATGATTPPFRAPGRKGLGIVSTHSETKTRDKKL
jgi:hypothetical protein